LVCGFRLVPLAAALSRTDTGSSRDIVLSDFLAGAFEAAGDLSVVLLGRSARDRVCFKAEPQPTSLPNGLFTTAAPAAAKL